MRTRRALLAALALVLTLHAGRTLTGCAGAPAAPTEASEARRTVVLISLDGFRWTTSTAGSTRRPSTGSRAACAPSDSCRSSRPRRSRTTTRSSPASTPRPTASRQLDARPEALGRRGAGALRDVEPRGRRRRAVVGRRAVWVTAERQGLRAAPLFGRARRPRCGVRPSFWRAFDGDLAFEARADTVLAWLDAGAAYASFYVEAVDSAGHRFGPDAPETNARHRARRCRRRVPPGRPARTRAPGRHRHRRGERPRHDGRLA